MKHHERIFKVKPNHKAVSSPWFEVLKWLVTFGRKGSTHKVIEIKTPEHVNCRCVTDIEFIRPAHCIHCYQVIGINDTTCPHCGEDQ